MSNSTLTVQQVINYASQHAQLMPLVGVGGIANEPALSIANDTFAELIAEKFPWKFNRVVAPMFVTSQGKQDYKFAGAAAFTANYGAAIGLASANAITESSFTVTVNTIEPHNFSIGDTVYMTGNVLAAYNSTFTATPSGSAWSGGWTILSTPTTKSFTFTHASSGLGASGAPGITNLGWLESGSMVTLGDTAFPQGVTSLLAVRSLQPVSTIGVTDRVCIFADDGAGTLTIRLRWIPGATPRGVTLVYQASAPLITALSGAGGTFAPFPDSLGFVIRQMFLAMSYRFAQSPKEDVEYQKALLAMQAALGSDDRELSEEYISPDVSLMPGYSGWGGWSL